MSSTLQAAYRYNEQLLEKKLAVTQVQVISGLVVWILLIASLGRSCAVIRIGARCATMLAHGKRRATRPGVRKTALRDHRTHPAPVLFFRDNEGIALPTAPNRTNRSTPSVYAILSRNCLRCPTQQCGSGDRHQQPMLCRASPDGTAPRFFRRPASARPSCGRPDRSSVRSFG